MRIFLLGTDGEGQDFLFVQIGETFLGHWFTLTQSVIPAKAGIPKKRASIIEALLDEGPGSRRWRARDDIYITYLLLLSVLSQRGKRFSFWLEF